jgi:hypothetical protein
VYDQRIAAACRQLREKSNENPYEIVRELVDKKRNVVPIGVLLHSTSASTSELEVLEKAGAAGVISPGCAELFEAFEPDVLGAMSAADQPAFSPPQRNGK